MYVHNYSLSLCDHKGRCPFRSAIDIKSFPAFIWYMYIIIQYYRCVWFPHFIIQFIWHTLILHITSTQNISICHSEKYENIDFCQICCWFWLIFFMYVLSEQKNNFIIYKYHNKNFLMKKFKIKTQCYNKFEKTHHRNKTYNSRALNWKK